MNEPAFAWTTEPWITKVIHSMTTNMNAAKDDEEFTGVLLYWLNLIGWEAYKAGGHDAVAAYKILEDRKKNGLVIAKS